MKNTFSYCFKFDSRVFSWASKKQEFVAMTTAETKFTAAIAAINQALW